MPTIKHLLTQAGSFQIKTITTWLMKILEEEKSGKGGPGKAFYGENKDEWKRKRKAMLGWRQGPSCPATSHSQWCMICQGYEKCSGVFSHKLSKPAAGCRQLQDFLSLRLV